MSLQDTERAAAANASAPRVKLTDIEAAIAAVYYTNAERALEGEAITEFRGGLRLLTLCFVVMRNGFIIIGKSAPASPYNFNEDLGRKFAYEDAIRQISPLMDYELRSRLAGQA